MHNNLIYLCIFRIYLKFNFVHNSVPFRPATTNVKMKLMKERDRENSEKRATLFENYVAANCEC